MENIVKSIISVARTIDMASRRGKPNYVMIPSHMLNISSFASHVLDSIKETRGTMDITTGAGIIRIKFDGIYNLAGNPFYRYKDEKGDRHVFDKKTVIDHLNKLNEVADD